MLAGAGKWKHGRARFWTGERGRYGAAIDLIGGAISWRGRAQNVGQEGQNVGQEGQCRVKREREMGPRSRSAATLTRPASSCPAEYHIVSGRGLNETPLPVVLEVFPQMDTTESRDIRPISQQTTPAQAFALMLETACEQFEVLQLLLKNEINVTSKDLGRRA
jgi:hypothetical protein